MNNRYIYLSLVLLIGAALHLQAQDGSYTHHRPTVFTNNLNPDWKPFYHGIASGDPLVDRVIIWTRVTPDDLNTDVEVEWQIASDPQFENILQGGISTTSAIQDFTVKVDVTSLTPNTTYYYVFKALGRFSLIGKTKTTPIGTQSEHLRFGVVSCSSYQSGYFTGYQALAARTDLDAIIHLGDYIYEYPARAYGNPDLFDTRIVDPGKELIDLEDYRIRYSTYRLDTNLVRAHQQHPFIAVWDDHEIANDAYRDGALNHNEIRRIDTAFTASGAIERIDTTFAQEGDWEVRKNNAKQAYFEWMPIRENNQAQVYRRIQYGDLMDLLLLDTRLEGREEQIRTLDNPALEEEERSLLGTAQKDWLFEALDQSTAQWKIIGQQILFAPFNIGWGSISGLFGSNYNDLEGTFHDIWDGYPAERRQLLDFIQQQQTQNVVILSGDFHCSFANDLTTQPTDVNFRSLPFLGQVPVYTPNDSYNATTGQGSLAVEFVTPSLTSPNFNERLSPSNAAILQNQMNQDLAVSGIINLGNPNPHIKWLDLMQHGYLLLDVKPDSVQANWYFTDITQPQSNEQFARAWYTMTNENHVQSATQASTPKPIQDTPAPLHPFGQMTTTESVQSIHFTVLAAYPNPANTSNQLHYTLSSKQSIKIQLINQQGQLIRLLTDSTMPAGIYSILVDLSGLPAGLYYYSIQVEEQQQLVQFIVQ